MNKLSFLFVLLGIAIAVPLQSTLVWDSVWESGACGHMTFKNSLGTQAKQFHFTALMCEDIKVNSIWSGVKKDIGIVQTRAGPAYKWRLTSESWWNLKDGATDLQTIGFCLSHPIGIAVNDQNFKTGVELVAEKVAEPTCGNGVCDAGENKDNCACDCENLICAVKIMWDSQWGNGRCGHVEFQNYKKETVTQFLFNIQLCDLGGSDITALWTGDKKKLGTENGAVKWLMKSAGWWTLAPSAEDKSTIGFCISHPKDKWTKDNMRVWLHLCTGGPCQGSCGNGVCDNGESVGNCPQDCLVSSWCSLIKRETMSKLLQQESSTSTQMTTVSPKNNENDKTNTLLLVAVIGIFCILILGIGVSFALIKNRKNYSSMAPKSEIMVTNDNI